MPAARKDPKLKAMMEKLSNIGEMDPPPGFNLEDAGQLSGHNMFNIDDKMEEERKISQMDQSPITFTDPDELASHVKPFNVNEQLIFTDGDFNVQEQFQTMSNFKSPEIIED